MSDACNVGCWMLDARRLFLWLFAPNPELSRVWAKLSPANARQSLRGYKLTHPSAMRRREAQSLGFGLFRCLSLAVVVQLLADLLGRDS